MILSKAMRQFCLTTFFTILGTATVFAADMGQASGTGVNVRAGAGTDAAVVGKINEGSEYTVLGKSGDWFKISYNEEDAFVSSDYFELTKAEGTIKGSGINVRENATTSSDSLGKLSDGETVTVTGRNDGWYRISYEGRAAYVSADFVSGEYLSSVEKIADVKETKTEEKNEEEETLEATYGVVNATSGLKLRKEASTNSNVLTVLPYGTEVNVERVGNEWIRVVTDGGQKGYVSADFLSVRKGERTSRSNASSKGAEVVSYAKQFVGTPYVWGGTNLRKGVDCSGFVYAVMRDFSVSVSRSSATMANDGVAVSKADLAAGDLVFFNTGGNSSISHVGIYMGDGNYIHSTDGKGNGVTITSLNSAYSANTYVTARRVLR